MLYQLLTPGFICSLEGYHGSTGEILTATFQFRDIGKHRACQKFVLEDDHISASACCLRRPRADQGSFIRSERAEGNRNCVQTGTTEELISELRRKKARHGFRLPDFKLQIKAIAHPGYCWARQTLFFLTTHECPGTTSCHLDLRQFHHAVSTPQMQPSGCRNYIGAIGKIASKEKALPPFTLSCDRMTSLKPFPCHRASEELASSLACLIQSGPIYLSSVRSCQ